MIPLANPAREHEALATSIEAAVLRVLREGHYILGPEVEAFEREFAAWLGVPHVVSVSNGSDAIVAALQALDIGPGDEVLTTSFSYFATASAITRAGATPIFVDLEPGTYNLDVGQLEARVTPRTRAVLCVHLFGRMCDVDALEALCHRLGLHLLEDCAQASGATFRGRLAGTVGTIGTYSFFPAKPLGGAGDGGACSAREARVEAALRCVRVTGATAKNVHDRPGGNYRLDPVQAAVLRAKLPAFPARLARRRSNAAFLLDALAGTPELELPTLQAEGESAWAQFTVAHPRRDALAAGLRARGVAAEVYYPRPMPLQAVFASLGHKAGEFPVAERAAATCLSIPVHSELTEQELSAVAKATREAAQEALR